MTPSQLTELDAKSLADYVWKRLRRGEPLDPPLASRFGDEEPERVLMEAAEKDRSSAFRRRLVDAIREHFRRLAERQAGSGQQSPPAQVDDQQIASLAFLISELNAVELFEALYLFALGWFLGQAPAVRDLSFGQTHILRTLAHLQPEDSGLSKFWRDLWERAPRSVRGIVIFGWARADAAEALGRLGELADSVTAIDLPATVWSLIWPPGPGLIAVAKAAGRCTETQRKSLRKALEATGAAQHALRDFDLAVGLPSGDGDGFRWPPSLPTIEFKQPLKMAA